MGLGFRVRGWDGPPLILSVLNRDFRTPPPPNYTPLLRTVSIRGNIPSCIGF